MTHPVMATIATPPAGEVSLHLGNSFQDPHRDPAYWSLRYDFKPASLNSEAPGTLRMGDENQVSLDLLNKSAGNGDLGFTGHSETYDGLDCVAVFDGTQWRLELLKGSLKVRHVKGQTRASPAPQALPTTTTHSVADDQLQTSSMDAANTQAEAENWLSRGLSQEASEAQPSSEHTPGADAASDSATDSEDEEAGPVQQPADAYMQDAAETNLHPHANGHLDAHAHQRPDSVEQDTEEEEGEGGDEEAEEQPQSSAPNGLPMTDLERQFFANSQPPSSESSDSSSDSDQDSLNAASEDDDDGLDHF